MSVIGIILIASLKLASFQDWFWFGSDRVMCSPLNYCGGQGDGKHWLAKIGDWVLPKRWGEWFPSGKSQKAVSSRRGNGLCADKTRSLLKVSPSRAWKWDKELNFAQPLICCGNRQFFGEQVLLSTYNVLHVTFLLTMYYMFILHKFNNNIISKENKNFF